MSGLKFLLRHWVFNIFLIIINIYNKVSKSQIYILIIFRKEERMNNYNYNKIGNFFQRS